MGEKRNRVNLIEEKSMITIRRTLIAAVALNVAAASFTVAPYPAVSAEEHISGSDAELLRADLRTKKMELVADRMQFTEKEADAFWPLYRKYEVELAAINDKKIAVIQEYLKSHDNLDAARAKHLAQQVFEVDQNTLDLRKKYFQEMAGVLSPKTAARFLQLERRLQQLLDVQLASDFPLIKK
jgi:Spy/CpxP family protein refolding chaperone